MSVCIDPNKEMKEAGCASRLYNDPEKVKYRLSGTLWCCLTSHWWVDWCSLSWVIVLAWCVPVKLETCTQNLKLCIPSSPPPTPTPAGSALRVFQLWTGWGSGGQLFQLPELWRVRAVPGPLLCLDRVAVSGREDGAAWQVSHRTHSSDSRGARLFFAQLPFCVCKERFAGNVTAEGHLVFLAFSHWQQDVEEADTSVICNRTSHRTSLGPRSASPAASRECGAWVAFHLQY